MVRDKPRYDAPMLVHLDRMGQASGDCADGSTVMDMCFGGDQVVGTCTNGGLPAADCFGGSAPTGRLCSAGGAYNSIP